MLARPLLALLLAGGATLAAQSLKPGLNLIPASVEHVEIYLRPAEIEVNGKALSALFGQEDSFIALAGKTGLEAADLSPGALFIAEYPTPKPAPAKEGEAAPAVPAPFLVVLPAAQGEALLTRLHAKAERGIWTYQVPGSAGKEAEARFAALRSGFLLVSGDRPTLESALASKQMIGAEVDAPLEAWLASHDANVLLSGQETRSELADLVKEVEKPDAEANSMASMTPRIRVLALKAQASVAHVGVGFDVAKDGTVRAAGRFFYRPGSPLALEAAALAPLGVHPLAGLPQDPFALAFGGQWPDALNFLASNPDVALAAFKGHALPEAPKAKYLAAMKGQMDQVQSMAMLISPPAKAGDPLLKGAVMVLRVKDPKAYQAAQEQVTALQGELAKAAGMAPFSSFEKDVLPGTPSFSLSADLAQAQGPQGLPPQASMVFGFLFGGTTMRQSYGQLDPHTWLGIFGTPEDLSWALLRAKQAGPLPEMATLKREDELLPAASRFSLYLDLKGLRDLAQVVASAFGKNDLGLPQVPSVPPFGLAFTCDAGGFEVRGGAHPESLKAARAFFEAVSKLVPKQPENHD